MQAKILPVNYPPKILSTKTPVSPHMWFLVLHSPIYRTIPKTKPQHVQCFYNKTDPSTCVL